jgi:hypothetical protein
LQFIPLTATTTLRRSERFALIPKTNNNSNNDNNGNNDNNINSSSNNPSTAEDADQAALDRVNYLNQVLLEEDTLLCESVSIYLSIYLFHV